MELKKAAVWLAFCAAAATAQDRGVTIQWIGQSCFIIRSVDGGQTVVTDPPAASVGYRLPSMTGDAVFITHNHSDHNNSAAVSGNFALVDGRPVTARQELTAGGIPFVMIPGFHDNQNGALRGPNTSMRWTQAGLKFAHLGDFGQDDFTPAQLADLTDLDVLFIPAGGAPFTTAPERMATLMQQIRARVTILMHYHTALGGPATTGSLPAVASPFATLLYKPATLTVSKASLPESPQTWVMLPTSDAAAVNGASFDDAQPVAPGSVVAIFGKFTGSATQATGGYPLQRALGGTQVLVDGKAAPLYYVSPGQVNVQLPAGTPAGQSLADVQVGGQSVGRAAVTVLPLAPALFGAVNRDGKINSPNAPAHLGDTLVIFGTGLGAVSPAVDDGVAAPQQPLSSGSTPNVFLSQRQLPVQFSGLAPGFAGVWQINVALPRDAPTGPDLTLTVENGRTAQLKVTVVQ